MSRPVCKCWRLNPDGTHEARCPLASPGNETAREERCPSIGPRIGTEGRPVCSLPKGHDGRHASDYDATGFDETWHDQRPAPVPSPGAPDEVEALAALREEMFRSEFRVVPTTSTMPQHVVPSGHAQQVWHKIAALFATQVAEAQAQALRDALRETCREWPEGGERCNAPADFILWGKLFPSEALGPRCMAHAIDHIGDSWFPHRADQYAVFDLRADRLTRGEGAHE